MIEAAGFDYAQARLQARHGMRPSEAGWSAIDGAVTLGQFVENIRATALASSLDFFRPTTSAHEAEQALRSAWRRSVFEAARWTPGAWRSAVRWLASATELSVLTHLLRGEPLPSWLKSDPVWQRTLEAHSESAHGIVATISRRAPTLAESAAQATASTPARSFSLREQLVETFSRLDFEEPLAASALAGHEPAADGTDARGVAPASVLDAWVAEWRSRWPRTDTDTRHALEALIVSVRRHLEEMRSAESTAAGRALRHELRFRLTHSLHAHAQTPVALIAHLLLIALDFERLRDGLIRRIVSG
jgi:hypothetical protein